MACHHPLGNMGIPARPVIPWDQVPRHCRNTEVKIHVLERLLLIAEVFQYPVAFRSSVDAEGLRLETGNVILGGLASFYQSTGL